MIQLLTFNSFDEDLERFKSKYDVAQQSIYFSQILITKDVEKTQMDISMNVEELDFFFPLNYEVKSKMLNIQVKQIGFSKRE